MIVLKGSIALLQLILLGTIITFLLDKEDNSIYYRIALSYIVGSVIFSWFLFIFSLIFSFYPSFQLVFLLTTVLIISLLFFSLSFRQQIKKFLRKSEIVKLFIFIIFFIYWEIGSISVPLFNYDELTQWGAKGVFLFYEKKPLIPPFMSEYFFHGHKKYPLLIPYLESWIHYSIGKVELSVCKIIFPPYLFSLLIIIFEHLNKKIKNNLISVFPIILLISLNPVFNKSFSGYMDVPLACFYTFTLLMIIDWHETRKKTYLFYAGIGLQSLFFTKNEGYMFYMIIFFIIVLLSFYDYFKNKTFTFYNFLPILFSLPFLLLWIKISLSFAPSGEDYFKYIKDLNHILQNLNKIPLILKSWSKVFMNYKSWGGLWLFYFAFPFLFFIFNRRFINWIYFLATYLPILGYFIIFIISPLNPDYLTKSALGRLLIHFLPLWVYFFIIFITPCNKKFLKTP